MKRMFQQIITAAISISLLFPVVAYANTNHDEGDVPIADKAQQETRATLQSRKEERAAKLETKRADLNERLDSAKKKICERHQSRVNNIMSAMNKRRKNAFDRITSASDKILAFSNKKSLSFENYDAIVAKIDAAKSAAESTMSAQQSSVTLNCDGEHPRADMSEFKEKRSDSVDAMMLYRDSVKELATAVKQAAKDARVATQEGSEQ